MSTVNFELNLSECDVHDVMSALHSLADGTGSSVSGAFAGGSEGFIHPTRVDDLLSDRPFAYLSLQLVPAESVPGSPRVRLGLEFTGLAEVTGNELRYTNYRCHHVLADAFVNDDDPESWAWAWTVYRLFMSLNQLPAPWVRPSGMFERAGLLPDTPGTAATMTHRIPANIFNRSEEADPSLQHYGPMVHLSPDTLARIGHPEDHSELQPTRVEDLRHISVDHGVLVQMPLPIEEQELRAWREYLRPVLGLTSEPKREAIESIDAGYIFPVFPPVDPDQYVVPSDVVVDSFSDIEFDAENPDPSQIYVSVLDHRIQGEPLSAIDPRYEHRLAGRPGLFNVVVFANREAFTTPAYAMNYAQPVWRDRVCIVGSALAERVALVLAEKDPEIFAPALVWTRDFTQDPTVKTDAWKLSLITVDPDGDGSNLVRHESVSARFTKRNGVVLSAEEGQGSDVFVELVARADELFGGGLNEVPVAVRWRDLHDSRLDIERWIGMGNRSLSLADLAYNNRLALDWQLTQERRDIMAQNRVMGKTGRRNSGPSSSDILAGLV